MFDDKSSNNVGQIGFAVFNDDGRTQLVSITPEVYQRPDIVAAVANFVVPTITGEFEYGDEETMVAIIHDNATALMNGELTDPMRMGLMIVTALRMIGERFDRHPDDFSGWLMIDFRPDDSVCVGDLIGTCCDVGSAASSESFRFVCVDSDVPIPGKYIVEMIGNMAINSTKIEVPSQVH